MKTIFYSLAVVTACFFIAVNVSAQDQRDYDDPYNGNHNDSYQRPYDDQCKDDRQQSFYYYPQSNVYYSFNTGKYIFFDRNAWVVANLLPHYYRLRSEPRFVVYHNGFDVWNENRFHAMKYRDQMRFGPDVAYDNHDRHDDRDYQDRREGNWRR